MTEQEVTQQQLFEQLRDCIDNQFVATVKSLIDAGVDVNQKDKFGFTPLDWAVQSYPYEPDAEIVKLLIDADADVNHKREGKPPLYWALRHPENEPNEKIVKLLIDAGADVNYVDKYGFSLLYHTAFPYNREPNMNIVKLLIDAGADVNYRNRYFSLIDTAAYRDNMELVNLLREHGAKWTFKALLSIYFINPMRNYFSKPIAEYLNKHWKLDSELVEIYLLMIASLMFGSSLGLLACLPFVGSEALLSFFGAFCIGFILVTTLFGGFLWYQEKDRHYWEGKE